MPTPDLSRLTIAILDDSVVSRGMIRSMLAAFRIRAVQDWTDGDELLASMTTTAPDVVVAASEFKRGAGGVDMLRKLRRDGHVAWPTPVVLIMPAATRAEIRRAIAAGADYVLCRPFSAKQVHDRILRCVSTHRPLVRTANYCGPDRRRTIEPMGQRPERRRRALAAA